MPGFVKPMTSSNSSAKSCSRHGRNRHSYREQSSPSQGPPGHHQPPFCDRMPYFLDSGTNVFREVSPQQFHLNCTSPTAKRPRKIRPRNSTPPRPRWIDTARWCRSTRGSPNCSNRCEVFHRPARPDNPHRRDLARHDTTRPAMAHHPHRHSTTHLTTRAAGTRNTDHATKTGPRQHPARWPTSTVTDLVKRTCAQKRSSPTQNRPIPPKETTV